MSFRTANLLFFGLLAAEIYAIAAGRTDIEWLSKPALMIVLAISFGSKATGPAPLRFAIIGALGFSWLGDVFLLADKASGGLFVYGLAAFLAAHLCYIAFFLTVGRRNGRPRIPDLLVIAGIAFYTAALFGFVAPFTGDLVLPVALYALVISTMLAASFAAFDLKHGIAGRLCVAGTAIFVVSDSILAINRFALPFAGASVLVMLTYGLAQWLICEGARRSSAEKAIR
jgi:uncharacterized membrane protein YhhN